MLIHNVFPKFLILMVFFHELFDLSGECKFTFTDTLQSGVLNVKLTVLRVSVDIVHGLKVGWEKYAGVR